MAESVSAQKQRKKKRPKRQGSLDDIARQGEAIEALVQGEEPGEVHWPVEAHLKPVLS